MTFNVMRYGTKIKFKKTKNILVKDPEIQKLEKVAGK